jgi:DNA-binding MarR family transcriptional regulator
MWLMKRAFYQQRRALDEAVRPDGVTAAQAGVLSRLSEEPGLSGADLARELLITPQAAQVALTSLERRGLVERRPDASHGRILRAFLTKEGARLARLCTRAAFELQNKLLIGFDDDERALFVDFLDRIIQQGPPPGDDEGGID